ncbi:MAG: hypothetical protein WAM55_01425 [Methylovirgula sp.]
MASRLESATGRLVLALIPRPDETLTKRFQVAIDDDEAAMGAVRKSQDFPPTVSLVVIGKLEPGVIAIQSMCQGEVRAA